MIIHRAYKRELQPNKYQLMMLRRTAGCTRYAYNWGLAKAQEIKELEGKLPKFPELSRMWTQHKRDFGFEWLSEVQAVPTFDAIKDLNDAFQRFFKKQNKYPRFKKKGNCDSFRIARNHNETYALIIDDNHIRIPIIGIVKTKEWLKLNGAPINATVSREADRWYISIACEQNIPEPTPIEGEPIGVDLGLTSFAALSDGTKLDAPKPLAKELQKLKKLQRQHSKKQKGSQNRKKSAMKIAKLHQRITNIRKDYLHKTSTLLAKTKPIICVEDLNVKGMQQNDKLARHIADMSWSSFIGMLEYKTHWYGSTLLRADRYYPSSKTCSSCGYIMESMPLSVREWTCTSCGAEHDRDINAAKNILRICANM